MKNILFSSALALLIGGCAIVRPGEVGVKQRFGSLQDRTYLQGVYPLNPFTTKLVKVPVRTTNLTNSLEGLPSKEGLILTADLAVLYHVKPEYARTIISTIGVQYETTVLASVIRSAAADVMAKFYAKDMYTSAREEIEKEIAAEATRTLGDRGFVVEAVLLKQISLPAGLSQSIEAKLEADQEAQRMDFVLQRERKEAERKVIEAQGISNAQKIISEGLTPLLIEYKSLETFRMLSTSPNAKLIVTDGKTPYLLGGSDQPH